MDPRVQKMADVLITYSTGVKAGDWVIIEASTLGEPLAVACMEATLKAGGNPSVILTSEAAAETFLLHANDEQLGCIDPMTRMLVEEADVRLHIRAQENTRVLSAIDPSRVTILSKAQEPILATLMERAASGTLRWSLCAYPTHAAAQDAGLSLRAYENFLFGACMVDRPDPVAAWKQLQDRQQRLIEWLQGKKSVHITGPGTDLTVGLEGGIWINDSGHENVPGGEIFTAPDAAATEGTIQFTFPAFYRGREVPDVSLRFEGGRVVEAAAARDEDFLTQMLDMDEGARRLGEFAFGTNPGIQTFTKNTLFDEKIGGTLHMALGRAYPESGGTNESSLHWDMVFNLRNGCEVTVDGELFSKNGEFQV